MRLRERGRESTMIVVRHGKGLIDRPKLHVEGLLIHRRGLMILDFLSPQSCILNISLLACSSSSEFVRTAIKSVCVDFIVATTWHAGHHH